MSDYQQRATTFGLANKETLVQQLQDTRTVVVDVRTNDEIAVDGVFQPPGRNYHHVPCTATDASELAKQADSWFDNNTKDAPIIIYCRSGRRASTAKKVLLEAGYTNVLNAGGHDDIKAMKLPGQSVN
jgi:phage shock protein E